MTGLNMIKMKNETVKEIAERFWRNDETMSDYVQQAYITGFIAGSKWQQEQDREMEKERIIDAFDEGNSNGFIIKCGEQYYNETYKNETK